MQSLRYPEAPSIYIIPTLRGPKVYRYDLLWAIWSPGDIPEPETYVSYGPKSSNKAGKAITLRTFGAQVCLNNYQNQVEVYV